MTARAWLNLGLLTVLAALAAIAWLRPGQTPPQDARLLNLEADAIDRIAIERAGKPAVRLEKRNERWWLTSPIEIRASEARVASLLELAIKTSHARYAAAGLELARYGLAAPPVIVKLNGEAVAFGQVNPVNQRRYVQVGDTVHLINDVLFDLETAGAAAYASAALLPGDTNIRALRLPDIDINRTQSGTWASSPTALSRREIKTTLRAWRQASAIRVSAYEKRPSPDRVTVELEDGGAIVFDVIAREPALILARPGLRLQYHLPTGTAESLLSPVSGPVSDPPP
ncbi:MAG: DUF4340 domain-containing protein [Gammaproteobacteria bacterium]